MTDYYVVASLDFRHRGERLVDVSRGLLSVRVNKLKLVED